MYNNSSFGRGRVPLISILAITVIVILTSGFGSSSQESTKSIVTIDPDSNIPSINKGADVSGEPDEHIDPNSIPPDDDSSADLESDNSITAAKNDSTLLKVLPGEELFHKYAYKYEEAKDPEKAHKYKYLVWAPQTSGWGSVFRDYASGIAFALLTDRLIYLDRSGTYDDLLTSTIPAWQDWPAQKNILATTTQGQSCLDSHHHIDFDVTLYTSWLQDDHRNIAQCLISCTLQGDYVVPPLTSNPHYSDFFDSYTTKLNVFTLVANLMWKPSPAVQTALDNMTSQLSAYKYKIAMHITTERWKAEEKFPYAEFCDLAKSLAVTSGHKKEQVVVFVSADELNESIPLLEKCLKPYKLVYTPVAEATAVGGNPEMDLRALVDMFVMSKCDEVICTSGSSFGQVAAGFGSIVPWHVVPGNPASFYKQMNSEPCMDMSKTWHRIEGEKMESFLSNGLWRQYEACRSKDLERK